MGAPGACARKLRAPGSLVRLAKREPRQIPERLVIGVNVAALRG